MKTKRWVLAALWLIATLALSALTSWWMLRRVPHEHAHAHPGGAAEDAFHQWMHQNLELSAAQEAAMRPQEESFEKERRRLRQAIREAGAELARQVREADALDSPTTATLDRLGAAQRELQAATLAHFFQMRTHLTKRQRALLSRWTHDSLLHEHHE